MNTDSDDNETRWIHISDLHIGKRDNLWLNQTLYERLDDFFKDIGKIHFIIITGDIIHKGQYSNTQYCTEATKLMSKLKENCENLIFVPGNHDFTRENGRDQLLNAWQKFSIEEKNQNSEKYSSKLKQDFNEFSKFCKQFQNNTKTITKCPNCTIVNKINIVQLNTSIFCGQKENNRKNSGVNDEGKLWICDTDLINVTNLNKKFPTIVIGHHPIQMFDENSYNKLLNFFENLPARLYFCGHFHNVSVNTLNSKKIKQYTSSSFFNDAHNEALIALYKLNACINETPTCNLYKFKEGFWVHESIKKNKDESISSNLNKKHLKNANTPKRKETIVPISEVSDGAFRIPHNNCILNIYLTTPKSTDIASAHLHSNLDEITIVTKGILCAIIGNNTTIYKNNSHIIMPRNKLHAFIPLEIPCEYITLSVEQENIASYNSQWGDDLNQLKQLRKKIDTSHGTICEHIKETCKHLSSEILEIRWEATHILKKYIAERENPFAGEGAIIVSTIIEILSNKTNLNKNIWGLVMASEFGCNISNDIIKEIFVSNKNFMIAWTCAYYLIKQKHKLDYISIYVTLNTQKQTVHIKYKKIILSIVELIVNKNSDLLEKTSNNLNLKDELTLEDVLIHFAWWQTAFIVNNEEFSFALAAQHIKDKLNFIDSKTLLRTLLDKSNEKERWEKLQLCKKKKVLIDVLSIFYKSFTPKISMHEKASALKSNIKSYLRIIVSNKCNLRCSYCHNEGRISSLVGDKIKDNSMFDLKSLLDKAKENNFRKIKISGGEPLLVTDIISICNTFQNDFEDIGFTTNGTKIMELKSEFDKISPSKLTFNITLNSCNEEKYKKITGGTSCKEVKQGIEYLVKRGFSVKLNAVVTAYNFEDIEELISYAARLRIKIKLLDLFSASKSHQEIHQTIPIAEIKNKIIELYNISSDDFILEDDYLKARVMGTEVLIPSRVYSLDCKFNCNLYPCAEGLFGIRVYEDYSCARCFKGDVYQGNLENFSESIKEIRDELDKINFAY